MRRHEFNHVIAAAADAVGLDEFVIIGSQAILGEVPDPPEELLHSMEVDMYPLADPARADDIDAILGDGSWFEHTHGYFAHGVGPMTAKAPAGWMDRLIRVDIPPRVPGRAPVAYCMERHDLILAKLVRGSERDVDYARVALHGALLDSGVLLARLPDLPVHEVGRDRVARLVRGLVGGLPSDRPPPCVK